MKRFLIMMSCLMVGLAIALGGNLMSSTAATSSADVQKAKQSRVVVPVDSGVAQTTIQWLTRKGSGKQQPRVTRTKVIGEYALANWLWSEAGGQAALQRSVNGWKVLQAGGGAFNVQNLQGLGVPPDVAVQLLKR